MFHMKDIKLIWRSIIIIAFFFLLIFFFDVHTYMGAEEAFPLPKSGRARSPKLLK